MVDWGLDLAHIFDPTSQSLAVLSLLSKNGSYRYEKLQAIHQLAVSKEAYDKHANEWYEVPWHQPKLGMVDMTRFLVSTCLSNNPEAMQLILPHLRPGHYSLTAKDRLSFFDFAANDVDADSLRFLLRLDGKLSPEDVRELDQDGFPLIKLMAWRYKSQLAKNTRMSTKPQKWRMLSQDIIRTTAFLHCQTEPPGPYIDDLTGAYFLPGTPLLSVIGGSIHGFRSPRTFSEWRRYTERALRYWTEDLEACGIDLNIYGETERRLFIESRRLRPLCHEPNMHSFRWEKWGLENFKYGPKPRDWQFSWDLGIEALHGEFWDMVEDSPLYIIGAWVDD
jgi:hypothetical protein